MPMSSKLEKIYPFDLYVGKVITNYKKSKIMCEQVKSVSKKRLSDFLIERLFSQIYFIYRSKSGATRTVRTARNRRCEYF